MLIYIIYPIEYVETAEPKVCIRDLLLVLWKWQ